MDVFEASKHALAKMVESGANMSVIGGWAVWAYNPYKFSKDVDAVVGPRDTWKVRKVLLDDGFTETSGAHLGKRGFRKPVGDGVIDVDLYDGRVGPFEANEILERSVLKELFGHRTKVASPTDLLALKIHALLERRGSWKGEKDAADIIALLLATADEIEVDHLTQNIPRKRLAETAALLSASYQQTARYYSLSRAEYKRLKARLKRWVR